MKAFKLVRASYCFGRLGNQDMLKRYLRNLVCPAVPHYILEVKVKRHRTKFINTLVQVDFDTWVLVLQATMDLK